jgi:hypothetical protein
MLESEAMDPSVTQLLRAWSGGDAKALGELTPKVYTELRGQVHAE